MEQPGHYSSCEMREAKTLEKKKHNSQMAAMYQFHAGGVSHRTTSLYYDMANIESRLLRHQSVLTAENRNNLDNYSHSLCFCPVWHTGVALKKGPIYPKGPHTPSRAPYTLS